MGENLAKPEKGAERPEKLTDEEFWRRVREFLASAERSFKQTRGRL